MPEPGRPEAAVPIRAVVFDVGGVFLDWDPRHLYRKLFADPCAMEWFLHHIATAAWHTEHDRGVSIRDSCAALARRHPAFMAEVMAWVDRGEEMIGGEVPNMAGLLMALDTNGIPCYALTNMERETYPGRRERFGFFGHFVGVMVSGQEGLIKPDPALYQRLAARFGLEPARTLFIDDSPANVEAASRLGFATHRFDGAERLRARLMTAHLLPSS